jgi:hypothetical protein
VYTTLSKNFYHSGFFPLPIRKKPLDLQNLRHATLGEVPGGTGDIRVSFLNSKHTNFADPSLRANLSATNVGIIFN